MDDFKSLPFSLNIHEWQEFEKKKKLQPRYWVYKWKYAFKLIINPTLISETDFEHVKTIDFSCYFFIHLRIKEKVRREHTVSCLL